MVNGWLVALELMLRHDVTGAISPADATALKIHWQG
jgi:hypothetical protein